MFMPYYFYKTLDLHDPKHIIIIDSEFSVSNSLILH